MIYKSSYFEMADGVLPLSGDLEIVMAKELRRQYAKRERADAVILFLESAGVGQRINFAAQVGGGHSGSGGRDRALPPVEVLAEAPESPQRPQRKGRFYESDPAFWRENGGKKSKSY